VKFWLLSPTPNQVLRAQKMFRDSRVAITNTGQRRVRVYKCAICEVGLCVVPCFTEYHTKVNL
jgi:hypothetical protein